MLTFREQMTGKYLCEGCKGTGVCARRDTHQFIITDAEGTRTIEQASHDAYGNPYGADVTHVCCTCNGEKYKDCKHQFGLMVHPSTDNTIYPPMVACPMCGFRWLGIPGNRRNIPWFDILADAFTLYLEHPTDEALKQRCIDIMHQWPASEKQELTTPDKQLKATKVVTEQGIFCIVCGTIVNGSFCECNR